MNILLINPPINNLSRIPLGLGYIASVLLKEGHEVKLIDINGLGLKQKQVLKLIKKNSCEVVGIGGLVITYKYVKWLTHEIKKIKPKTKIVLGGGVGASIPELAFKNMNIDYIVDKEGELTIIDLLDNLDKPHRVKGIYYKENGTVHRTPDRELIQNLDKIPFPARNLFPKIYFKPSLRFHWKRKTNMICGRGCPFRCGFCWHNFGYNNRLRSPENIIEEIKSLKREYGVGYFLIDDELAVSQKEKFLEFCNKLAEEDLNIKWMCTTRVSSVDEELLRAMKKAGCDCISYGIESGSQRMLNAINKGTTVEQGKNAILLTRKIGIKADASFMVGVPGETKETIEETIDFCKKVKLPQQIKIYITTSFPSTPFYEYAKKKNLIKNEEEYLEKITGTVNLNLNLSNLPDDELVDLRNKAQKMISINWFEQLLENCRYSGLTNLIKWFFRQKRVIS